MWPYSPSALGLGHWMEHAVPASHGEPGREWLLAHAMFSIFGCGDQPCENRSHVHVEVWTNHILLLSILSLPPHISIAFSSSPSPSPLPWFVTSEYWTLYLSYCNDVLSKLTIYQFHFPLTCLSFHLFYHCFQYMRLRLQHHWECMCIVQDVHVHVRAEHTYITPCTKCLPTW